MFTSIRFTKMITLAAVALTASVTACNDLAPSGSKQKPVVATTETPKPIERTPPPTETSKPIERTAPPTIATEVAKPPVTVENDDDGPRPSDALSAARKMLDDKQYDKALKLTTVAVNRMSKRSGAWNTLGRVQLQMGKRKDAIESFEKAVDLNPKNSYARNNLGLA